MNWPRLFLQKEQFGTSAYKKVEWTAKFVEVAGGRGFFGRRAEERGGRHAFP